MTPAWSKEAPGIRLPDRALRVHPPGSGLAAQAAVLGWALIVLACLAWQVILPIGSLLTDRSLVGAARPVAGAKAEGRCSVDAGMLTSCHATLRAPRPGLPEIVRDVDYFFIDFHSGDYTIEVVADPARPELLTTDLGLDKIGNRTTTLLVLGPLFLLIGFIGLRIARRRVGAQRAISRALSGHVLRPVLLRMDRYALGSWTVSGLPPGPAATTTWSVARHARPIVIDPARKAVLGVTAGDGAVAMPLDAALAWLALSGAERSELVAQLAARPGAPFDADQRDAGLAALDSDDVRTERDRLRRGGRFAVIAGLCLAAIASAGAWMAFHPRDSDGGAGEPVELRRGDEAPSTGQVALHGEWHIDHLARTTRTDARAAYLETWVPVTAPGWRAPQPVSWIIRDASHGGTTSGLATRSGAIVDGLPPEARAALAREGIALAPAVHVLDVPLLPQDPLQMPAVVVFVLGTALSLGLLLGGAIVGARARRRAAILRG